MFQGQSKRRFMYMGQMLKTPYHILALLLKIWKSWCGPVVEHHHNMRSWLWTRTNVVVVVGVENSDDQTRLDQIDSKQSGRIPKWSLNSAQMVSPNTSRHKSKFLLCEQRTYFTFQSWTFSSSFSLLEAATRQWLRWNTNLAAKSVSIVCLRSANTKSH